MKTTKLCFLSLLGILSFTATAQTVTLTSSTPATGTYGGNSSVHIGNSSGNGTSSTGGGNTFVGKDSGRINTTGANNTFIGGLSGYNNVSGHSNIFIGINAGFTNASGTGNVFTGFNAGYYNTANDNSFYGYMSGHKNSTGSGNTFYGFQSGRDNVGGSQNTFLGLYSGVSNNSGSDNTFVGWATGPANTTGIYNTFVGRSAGDKNQSGNNNTFIGPFAGANNISGSSNVFLGFGAGSMETGSNKLYISNYSTSTPLIWGDFSASQLKLNGKVGIGAVTTFPTNAGGVNVSGYRLFVTGGILTDEVRVNLSSGGTWADYVFNKDYNLKSLQEVETFIKENGHLPNVPSAAQIKEEGIALGEMSKIQQEKIEELTLYLIKQNKEIEELKAQVKILLESKN